MYYSFWSQTKKLKPKTSICVPRQKHRRLQSLDLRRAGGRTRGCVCRDDGMWAYHRCDRNKCGSGCNNGGLDSGPFSAFVLNLDLSYKNRIASRRPILCPSIISISAIDNPYLILCIAFADAYHASMIPGQASSGSRLQWTTVVRSKVSLKYHASHALLIVLLSKAP